MSSHTGSCVCGAVRFQVEGALPGPDACHCQTCRKITGHFGVSTDVAKAALTVADASTVRWYASSDKVRRGFCSTCGSNLFFEPIHHDWIGVYLGAFDTPTNTAIALHVFVSEKGDYYDILDDAPQNLR